MTTATSADGLLTVTTDDANAGVFVKGMFGDEVIRTNKASNPKAGTNTTYWSLSGTAPTGNPALTRVASGGPAGAASFARSTWTATSGLVTGGLLYSSTSDPGMTAAPGQLVSASVQVRCSKIQRVQLALAYLNAAGTTLATTTSAQTVLVANTWTQLKIDQATAAPAGTAKVWAYVFSVAGTSGTVWQNGDTLDVTAVAVVDGATAPTTYFDGSTATAGPLHYRWIGGVDASPSEEYELGPHSPTHPIQVTFERDGLLVRSGDPAWAPGGIAHAYDHEAPLGASATWRAQPIFADGTTGDWSDPATLTVPAMADTVDCWVKPLNDPGASVACEVHTDRIEVSTQARAQISPIQGARLPSVAWDIRTPAPISVTLRTNTAAAKDAVQAALDLGPVLVQLRSSYGIADFYAIPLDATERFFAGMLSPLRDIPTVFQPVARPATVDSPLMVPGYSYADALAAAATYAASTALWPTYLDAMGL